MGLQVVSWSRRPEVEADQIERIHRITGHEGFVKGVTWDPVGNYLATQVSSASYGHG
jgi:WD40 repeat protein